MRVENEVLSDKTNESIEGIKKLIAEALERVARSVADEARSLAPIRTGHLRDSIQVVTDISDGQINIGIGSELDYSAFVELGTAHQAPHPYLTPASLPIPEKLKAELSR